MDITPQFPKDKNNINSYGPQGFIINKKIYKNAVIMNSEQLFEININFLPEINMEILRQILDSELEILIIGTGKSHLFIADNLKEQIKNSYPLIAINEMDSGAACRTYNILATEDRKVAVILMPL